MKIINSILAGQLRFYENEAEWGSQYIGLLTYVVADRIATFQGLVDTPTFLSDPLVRKEMKRQLQLSGADKMQWTRYRNGKPHLVSLSTKDIEED